jgi:hypothetical protein
MIRVSVPTPYPVRVTYHEGQSIFQELTATRPFFRAMVFLNKQFSCNYCLDRTRIPGCRVFAIHAGTPDYEMEAFRACCLDLTQQMVIFCTSILETTIIPGVDLVIDSCMQTRAYPGSTQTCLANKAMMDRRARRTGQTCPGRVIRMICEEGYQLIPEDEDSNVAGLQCESYEWSGVLMSMMKHRINPLMVFDSGSVAAPMMEAIQNTLNELIQAQCVTPNWRVTPLGKQAMRMSIPRSKLFFSPVLTAARISGFWNKKARMGGSKAKSLVRDRLVFVLVGLIVHQAGTASGGLFWRRRYPDPRVSFFAAGDDLHLRMNVLLNGLLAPNMDRFAKRYSINNRLLKNFRTMFQRVFRELDPALAEDPSLLLRLLQVDRHDNGTFSLRDQDLDTVRCRACPSVHWVQSYHSKSYFNRVYASDPEYGEWSTLRFPASSLDPQKHILPLVINNDTITLWMATPTSLRLVRRTFHELRSTQALWQDIQNSRREWKEVMDSVIQEIANEVAFRPGFVGAQETATEFSNRLQNLTWS